MSRTLSGLLSGDSDLTVNVNLAGLVAGNVPDLPTSKITTGTFEKNRIAGTGTWALSDIPQLPKTQIESSGTFGLDQIDLLGNNIALGGGDLSCGDISTLGGIAVQGTIQCNGLSTSDDDIALGLGDLGCQHVTATGDVMASGTVTANVAVVTTNVTATGTITRGLTDSTATAPLATVVCFQADATIVQGSAVKIAGGSMKIRPYLSSGGDDNCVGIATAAAVADDFVAVQVSGLMRAKVASLDSLGATPVAGQVCECVSGSLQSVGTTTATDATGFVLCYVGTLGTYDSLVMWVKGSVY